MVDGTDTDKGGGGKGPAVAVPPKRVQVLVQNLGPKLYKLGEVTDDPEILALYGDGSNRVGDVIGMVGVKVVRR